MSMRIPKKKALNKHWPKHQVFDWVSNESPAADESDRRRQARIGLHARRLFRLRHHRLGQAVRGLEVSSHLRPDHGHEVRSRTGDGRRQRRRPAGCDSLQRLVRAAQTEPETCRWISHKASFSNAYGGAEMYAYDVDGDGDNDIITSQAAHDFGLSWYEQIPEGDEAKFKHHLIMGSHPSENHYGVLFSELHSVNLADIDGDGLKDIVTGKTYYSHHKQSPMWDAGAVVYWFRLVRGKDGRRLDSLSSRRRSGHRPAAFRRGCQW